MQSPSLPPFPSAHNLPSCTLTPTQKPLKWEARSRLCCDHPHCVVCFHPNTYGYSGRSSAPRRWLRCRRCWPTRLQSPGSHEPGSRLDHRANACGRHWAPVTPPLCPCPPPTPAQLQLGGQLPECWPSFPEEGFVICFSCKETGALELNSLRSRGRDWCKLSRLRLEQRSLCVIRCLHHRKWNTLVGKRAHAFIP